MSNVSGQQTLARTILVVDPPGLHLAAVAFAYPILERRLTYSDAISSIMRAALRERIIADGSQLYMQDLRVRLERTMNRTIADVSREAAEKIRLGLRPSIALRQSKAVLEEIAHSINHHYGEALPRECVEFIVVEEVRKAIGMPSGAKRL